MVPPKAANCVGCGAPAPAVLVATPYTCTFCHRQQILQPPAPPAPPPRPHVPFPPPPPFGGRVILGRPSITARPPGGARALTAIIPLLVLVVVGAVVAFTVARGPGRAGMGAGSGSGPGSGGVTPPGERLQWSSSAQPSVIVVDVNRDGVEDFVGRYRILDLKSSESTQTEYIGAFDGKTFQRIWKSPPMGTLQQAGTGTAYGVAGDRVIVTDFRAQAHVLDLATGRESRVFALSDRARSICSPGERRGEVWIEVADRKNVVLDLATGAATPGPRPAWCAPRAGTSCEGHAFSGDACAPGNDERNDLYKAGFSVDLVIRASDAQAIALAKKSPGTPVPTLVSFDPRTRAIAWQATVAPDPALEGSNSFRPVVLAGGRLFTTYKTSTPAELHLVAFDAATGRRALDVKVPRGESGSDVRDLTVSAQRIYVPHWTWLDVFDARDGRHIETVGMW